MRERERGGSSNKCQREVGNGQTMKKERQPDLISDDGREKEKIVYI